MSPIARSVALDDVDFDECLEQHPGGVRVQFAPVCDLSGGAFLGPRELLDDPRTLRHVHDGPAHHDALHRGIGSSRASWLVVDRWAGTFLRSLTTPVPRG